MTDRYPGVAGKFYPDAPIELSQIISSCLQESGVTPAPEQVAAIVTPHAGYLYSGPTAGYAYNRVKGKQPERVVLLGRSHYYFFDGCQIDDHESWITPLGRLAVDSDFIQDKMQYPNVTITCNAHNEDHTLEVQIPFLQQVLGNVPIVPILFGCDPGDWHIEFGKFLASVLNPDDLLVASTDLSHFYPQEEANEIDQVSLQYVLNKDYHRLCDANAQGDCSMCGATAVVVAMAYALQRQADQWYLLHYETSGDRSRQYDRVVGYGAVSMEWPK